MSARTAWNPRLHGLECSECGAAYDLAAPRSTCTACGRPLIARYDLDAIARATPRDAAAGSGCDLWRWRLVLPFAPDHEVVNLGEGGTPLQPLAGMARAEGVARLWIKEEAPNPTHSFKARGLSLAVNAARAWGIDAIALPSAGNAGSAAAAYAAAAGMRCRITMPSDTPRAFMIEMRGLGAEVKLVPGTIAEAGKALAAWAPAKKWWNVATFKEPFRLEGKKTLGYEIAEQSGWRLPDAIFYPTGGGTGLVGMARAFEELKRLGWTQGPVPRMYAVQSEGCAPVVRAFESGASDIAPWVDAATVASGLRVPSPFADRLILKSIRESGGKAVAVGEDEMLLGMADLARNAGCFACPEGGATLAALRRMRAAGEIGSDARVVLFNTGSGLKYLEAWRVALALLRKRSRPAARVGER